MKHYVFTQIKRRRIWFCCPGGNYLLSVNNKNTIIGSDESMLVSWLAILNGSFLTGYYFKVSVVSIEPKKNAICRKMFETILRKSASQKC